MHVYRKEHLIIELFNLEILEIGSFVSNVILALACFLYYSSLKKITKTKYDKYLSLYFLFMSLSSVSGAFAHSLVLYTGIVLHLLTWVLTGLAILFIEFGMATKVYNPARFALFAKAQFIVYTLLVFYFLNFNVAKINMILGLLIIIVPILLVRIFKKNEKYYLTTVIGIITALIPAFFHRVAFTFGWIFNMNDLCHFVLIFIQFLIFTGLRQGIMEQDSIRLPEGI